MKSTVKSSVKELYDIYAKNRVHRYAAAFSYYVTLSFFPFIILVSIMIAPLHLNIMAISDIIEKVIPTGIVDIVNSHLEYLSSGDSDVMMWSAIIVLCTTASGAFRVLMDVMSDIQGKSRFSGFLGFLLSFVFAAAVLVFIYLACLFVVTGEWVLNLLDKQFANITFSGVWIWLRYLILFPLMFLFVRGVYAVTLPKMEHRFSRTPGAITATVLIVLVSMVFSWLMSLTNRYTLVYGSLASVAILMIWLYFCGIVLIMGNALNVVLERRRLEKIADEGLDLK